MKKDYTTPSMVITSFSNEVVIMNSGIQMLNDQQSSDKFTAININTGSGKWTS